MKNLVFAILGTVLSLVLLVLLAEGAVSLARGGLPGTSVSYGVYRLLTGQAWDAGLESPDDPNLRALSDAAEIEALLDKMRAGGVGLGNTPYRELKTEEASINAVIDGCMRQRPNLRKRLAQVVTRLFDPFDPIVAFWNADQVLDAEIRQFIDRYKFAEVGLTTNAHGDRVTLPVVESARKVIVGGDSVANGVLLDDRDTLASQLQQRDPARQYINTGVNGASAAEVICAIERAVTAYGGPVEELIYVYSENDFDADKTSGTPEEVVAWLKDFAAQQNLRKVTVVYAPYIYNVVPQITRFRGYRGDLFPHNSSEKARLERDVAAAGFRFIDFTDIALAENQAAGTMFAGLRLFLDHTHYSRLGTAKLVERLRAEEP